MGEMRNEHKEKIFCKKMRKNLVDEEKKRTFAEKLTLGV